MDRDDRGDLVEVFGFLLRATLSFARLMVRIVFWIAVVIGGVVFRTGVLLGFW